MTRCKGRRWLALAAAASLLATPTMAQQPSRPGAAPTLAEEVAAIQRTLDRLVGLLETQIENQRLDLLIKRIQLKERRLEPLERRLRDAEAELNGTQSELQSMRMMLEEQQRALDDEQIEGIDVPASDTRRMIADLERMIRAQESRIEDLQARVRRHEDALGEAREEIEILDDRLLEELE